MGGDPNRFPADPAHGRPGPGSRPSRSGWLPWVLLGLLLAFVVADPALPARGLEPDQVARIRQDLQVVGAAPRPTGSRQNQRIRTFLIESLRALALAPRVQTLPVEGTLVHNVVARIDGSASTGAVLVCAHYDSVDRCPGASDDGLGVTVLLHLARRAVAMAERRNDLIFLLTDGEELAMLGAKGFMGHHPWAGEVEVVVNLEAVGNRGRAVLIETGSDNGQLMELFTNHVSTPVVSSLAPELMGRLPNNTDFTLFSRHGLSGFNLALVDGASVYHSPNDTVERIPGSAIGHYGRVADELTTALTALDLDRIGGGPVTCFDLGNAAVVRYGSHLNTWFMVGAAVAFALLVRLRYRGAAGLVKTAALTLLAISLSAPAGFALCRLIQAEERQAMILLSALAAVVVQGLLWRHPPRCLAGTDPLLGPATILAALLLIGVFSAPGAAYLALWPLVFQSLVGLVRVRQGLRTGWQWSLAVALLLLPSLILLVPILHLLTGLATVRPWAGQALAAALTSLGITLLWPIPGLPPSRGLQRPAPPFRRQRLP